jgi:hypothetical protein
VAPKRKGEAKKGNQLDFTLPAGACALLEQLVELEEIGNNRSEIIRFLVETQLQVYVNNGTIHRRPRPKPDADKENG